MDNPQRTMIVLGAGVAGLSTALYLQRSGHQVTVIDPLPLNLCSPTPTTEYEEGNRLTRKQTAEQKTLFSITIPLFSGTKLSETNIIKPPNASARRVRCEDAARDCEGRGLTLSGSLH